VAGGAITVLLLPLTSTLLARPAPSSTARVCPSPAAAGRVSGQRAEVLKLYGYSTGAWGTGTVTATQPPCIQTAARRTGPEPDESPVHANPPLPPPALDSWLHAPRMIASAGRKGLGVRVRTGIFNNRGRAMEDRLLYRVPEVAVILNISRSKVYELFSSGDLESVKIDRSRLVRSSDLRAYVDGLRPVDKSA
jgi:excisionase family DNA binding protein